ncbi:hypothetical protein IV203_004709 [Nitzschia inconspicua]|uniref:DUF6824 domain-containing protein n=1 Tax=Nitzschia inconspicua TaxID=303405 RepID=A0A9K3K861_9STRA|nr:hypothetical protein IV203_004709 [Nitzschia inconspicua]
MPPADNGEAIKIPHDHDVLSGRGNFVNYHPGNEYFRALVRDHKVDTESPGRFLKQDHSSKLWYDIGEKKALDKTRQALREGAPDLMKELSGESGEDTDDDEPVIARKKTPNKNSTAKAGATTGLGGMLSVDNMQNPYIGGFSSPESYRGTV